MKMRRNQPQSSPGEQTKAPFLVESGTNSTTLGLEVTSSTEQEGIHVQTPKSPVPKYDNTLGLLRFEDGWGGWQGVWAHRT